MNRRVEVGAVAVLGIAGPHGVAAAPAGAALVVLHGIEEVIVSSFGFVDCVGFIAGDLYGQLFDFAVDRNEFVGLDVALHGRGHNARLRIFGLELFVVATWNSRRLTSYCSEKSRLVCTGLLISA